MARSIHCLHCGVTLNLPAQAEGRKVKCPKCGGRFQVGDRADAPKAPAPAVPEMNPDSTFELTRKAGSVEMPVMPVADGDLRETFELPMMSEPAASGLSPSKVPVNARQAADATALFDNKPGAPRRKTGAEGRATARRCTTCGGHVPIGMSICQTCGLDLDTGMRVGLGDDLAPPPPPKPSLPIPIAVLGGLSLAASLSLALFAFVQWQGGAEGLQYFVPVAGFGAYAAVQFLRRKSVKLLLVALTLGATIDLIGLIAMPIVRAQTDTPVIQRTTTNPDDEDVLIPSVAERLDTNRMTSGIILLVVYAVVSIYLLSPGVQRHYRK